MCLGVGIHESNPTMQTYYVVVSSEGMLDFRRTVTRAFIEAGGQADDFDAEAYWPHVTLGFTKRDLFESDGVIKNLETCPRMDNLSMR